MPFLGLDALQWFVALDVGVLLASSSTAAALFLKLQRRHRRERLERRLEGAPVER